MGLLTNNGKYRPEVDGLRAVAVVPVILFHAGFQWIRGGFIGVDVFFVISGFLITGIVVDDLRSGRFSIAHFYERRARRILPALFAVMLVCLPLAWEWMTPSQLKNFAECIVAVALFSSNIFFSLTSGYFAPGVEENPLLHTWSLGVEEQFYLAFPLLLVAAWHGGRKWALGVTLAVALCSISIAQWGVHRNAASNFFMTPGRAWELMLGALVALASLDRPIAERVRRKAAELLATAGILMIGASLMLFSSATPFPSLYTLLPAVGTALVLGFSSPNTYVGRLLARPLLVSIGLMSYSAYLIHQPLFAFARILTLSRVPTSLTVVLILLTFPLAALSSHYVEAPFRAARRYKRRQIFGVSAAVSACFIAVGLTRYYSDRRNHTSWWLRSNLGLGASCELEGAFEPLRACETSKSPDAMVWGDSYAMHLVPGIIASDGTAKIVQATRSGCGPFLNIAPISKKDLSTASQWATSCTAFNQSVLRYLERQPGIRTVILASVFVQYVDSTVSELATSRGTVPASPEIAAASMRMTIATLRQLGRKVVVVAPPPSGGYDMGICVERRRDAKPILGPYSDCMIDRADYARRNSSVIKFLNTLKGDVSLFDFDGALCRGEKCVTSMAGIALFRDHGHFSYDGIEYLGRKMAMLSLLEQLAR